MEVMKMRTFRYLAVPLVVGLGLLAGPWSGVQAKAKSDTVTIHITTTGTTVWGKVSASYTKAGNLVKKTCSGTSCTWKIANATKVKFSEKPTNSKTWPFKDWGYQKGSGSIKTSTKTSLTLTISGTYSINAVYIVK
jgi:hypothetical protein